MRSKSQSQSDKTKRTQQQRTPQQQQNPGVLARILQAALGRPAPAQNDKFNKTTK